MKRIIHALALFGLVAAPALGEEPFNNLNFEQACKKAKKENKVVMIDFYTTWCGPCKMLDKTTWKDERVIRWLTENAIALKLDAEKERDLAQKYKVRGYPSIVFIKSDGTAIDTLLGFRSADQFLAEAKSTLTGKDSVARAKEKLGGDAGNDPMKRGQYARALAQQGKHKEALKEFLWCFDHGNEHSMGYGGVRLSFLLNDIASLGENYPPAIKALEKRRDAAKARLFPEDPDELDQRKRADAAMELAALNDTLHKSSQTLKAFDQLKREGDSSLMARRAMRHRIDELLLKKKRYDDFIESDKSAMDAIDQSIKQYEMSASYSHGQPKDQREELEKAMKHNAIEEGGKYYEAAAGMEKYKLASRIAKKLLKFAPGVDTYRSLLKHAQRADKPEAAQALIKMAEEDLNGEDLSDLKRLSENNTSSGD